MHLSLLYMHLWSSCHLLLKLLYLLSAASAILNSSTGDLMIWHGNQFYLLKAVIWFLPAKAILTFNTEVTAWVGKTQWRNFMSSPVVLNLLLKACTNGVSTISGGNESQLFRTLILKAIFFFFSFFLLFFFFLFFLNRLVHLSCLSFYNCVL